MRMLNYSSNCTNPFHRDYHRRKSPRQVKKKVIRGQLVSKVSPSLPQGEVPGINGKPIIDSHEPEKLGVTNDPLLPKEIPFLPGTVFTKVTGPYSSQTSMASSDSYSEITYPLASSYSSELEETTASSNRQTDPYHLDLVPQQKHLKSSKQRGMEQERMSSSERGTMGKFSGMTLEDTLAWRRNISSQITTHEYMSSTLKKGSQHANQHSTILSPASTSSTAESKASQSSTRNVELSAINAARKVRQRLKDAKVNIRTKAGQQGGLPDFTALKAGLKKRKGVIETTSQTESCQYRHHSVPISSHSTVTSATTASESYDNSDVHESSERSTDFEYVTTVDKPLLLREEGGVNYEDGLKECNVTLDAGDDECSDEKEDDRNYPQNGGNNHSTSRQLDIEVRDAQDVHRSVHEKLDHVLSGCHPGNPAHRVCSHIAKVRTPTPPSSRPKENLNPAESHQTNQEDDGSDECKGSECRETKVDIHVALNTMFSQRVEGQKIKKSNMKKQHKKSLSDPKTEKKRVQENLNALLSFRAQLPVHAASPRYRQKEKTQPNFDVDKSDSGQLRSRQLHDEVLDPIESRDDRENVSRDESDRDEYDKYTKMLKLGIPEGAVQNAMKRDGVDPSRMFGGNSEEVRKDITGKDKCKRDPYRRTRLHWVPVENFSKESIWHQLKLDKDLDNIHIDMDEFNSLFQTKASVVSVPSRSKETSQEGAVKVIDPKRANNGGIILARLRMTHDELAAGIDSIDESFLTAQQITGIMEYIPTSEERNALNRFVQNGQDVSILCECEKFMVSMMKVKEAKKKMEAMLYKLHFPVMVNDLITTIETLSQACDDVLRSNRLLKLLGVILKVGNRLNRAGVETIKTDAGGFAIESLRKLNQVKAWDKKTTLMMYIICIIQRWNEDLLDVKVELPHVLKTQKVTDYIPTLLGLEKQLVDVRKTALLMKVDEHQSTSDEEELLRRSQVGIFVLNSAETLERVRRTSDDFEKKFIDVLHYLAQKGDIKAVDLFHIVASFCLELDSTRSQYDEKKHFSSCR